LNPRKLMTILIAAILLATLAATSGCENHDGNQWQRLVCEVQSINGGLPLVSAYLNAGNDGLVGTEDDFLPIDWVVVTFVARPYNAMIVLPEDGPYSWFHVTNYDLTWLPGPGAPAELTTYNVVNGMCDAIVPVHEEGAVSVLIADRGMKDQPWYVDRLFVNGESYTASCQLTFRGHETGSDELIELIGGFTVTFYGVITDN